MIGRLVDGQTYSETMTCSLKPTHEPLMILTRGSKQPPMCDERECISERKSRRRAGGCVASDTLPRSRARDREVVGACRRRRPARSERERITFSSSTAELSMVATPERRRRRPLRPHLVRFRRRRHGPRRTRGKANKRPPAAQNTK